MRAKAEIEPMKKGDRQQIVISEIPYQVNKAKLIERIADLVRDKTIEGISDIRDESDRDGMRIVIELKRGEVGEVVLNNLYKHTQLQQTFGIIMLAIVAGRPRVLSLLEVIEHFIEFRRDVVRRRIEFELRKAEARAHILEGLRIALDNLDAVITLIRASKTTPEAKVGLVTTFGLSEIQAQAILDMQLQRLTGLERQKILDELAELMQLIERLRGILASQPLLLQIIVDELKAAQDKFSDPRRTDIIDDESEFSIEDLIADEDVAITVTDTGYIKRTPISTYRNQRRGGKGRIGMRTREEDVVNHLFVASTHSYMMIFTDRGRAYWLKVHEIPDVGADGRGKSIANLVQMEAGEKIAAMVAVREFDDGHHVVMGTRQGTIKKTELSAFANPRAGGIIAMGIDEGDEVIAVQVSDGAEPDLHRQPRRHGHPLPRGRRPADGPDRLRRARHQPARGRRSGGDGGGQAGRHAADRHRARLRQADAAWTSTAVQSRGGLGLKNVEITEKNGKVIEIAQVDGRREELLLITEQGKILRTPTEDIRTIGRATQGVRLMDLEEGDKLVSVALVDKFDEPPPAEAVPDAPEAPPED